MESSKKNIGKKGKLTSELINKAVLVLVIILVLFSVYAAVVPEAGSAGDQLNNSNRCADANGFWSGTQCQVNATNTTQVPFQQVPLNTLFSSDGVAILIVMAALLILVVAGLLKGKKQ